MLLTWFNPAMCKGPEKIVNVRLGRRGFNSGDLPFSSYLFSILEKIYVLFYTDTGGNKFLQF